MLWEGESAFPRVAPWVLPWRQSYTHAHRGKVELVQLSGLLGEVDEVKLGVGCWGLGRS